MSENERATETDLTTDAALTTLWAEVDELASGLWEMPRVELQRVPSLSGRGALYRASLTGEAIPTGPGFGDSPTAALLVLRLEVEERLERQRAIAPREAAEATLAAAKGG